MPAFGVPEMPAFGRRKCRVWGGGPDKAESGRIWVGGFHIWVGRSIFGTSIFGWAATKKA